MIIDQALQEATKRLVEAGIETAALDASVLMSHVTGREKIELITHHKEEITEAEKKAYDAVIKRREGKEPVAYIVGEKEFWGKSFKVSPGVLVPRPDTETIIATLLALVPGKDAEAKVADLGVGSGCILISLLLEFPKFMGFAVDQSKGALKMTAKNAANHDVTDRLHLYQGNWAEPLEEKMNIIVSNPPYIRQSDMLTLMDDVKDFEPESALNGGESGLKCYRELIPSAYEKLIGSGLLLLEVGHDQAEDVLALLDKNKWSEKMTFKDLSGHDRVVAAVRNT